MEPRRFRALPRVEVEGRRVPLARTVRARLLGLALLSRARAGEGLLIPRCRSVHTIGMRFAIDVVFLDPGGRPLRAVQGLRAWRIVACAGAESVLELPAGGVGDGPPG